MNEILQLAIRALDEKKAEHIIAYDFHDVNPYVEYVVITSASNQRLVWALADHVVDCAKATGFPVKVIEGTPESRWVLVDLYDVIVHVFIDEEREHYALERLYADIPRLAKL